MPRSVSSTLKMAVSKEETDEVFLILLAIYHPDIGPPNALYFVQNTENITSNGNEHIAFDFDVALVDDVDDQLPRVQLGIDAVDQSIIRELRQLTGPLTIYISVVLASDPDTIETGPHELTLRHADWDKHTIVGDLQAEDLLNEPYPGIFFTPENFPGLFANA